MNFSSIIYPGQTVVVSYDQSDAGTDALADAAGNKVASFTTGEDDVPAVVNNSTQVPPPAKPTGLTATASGVAPEIGLSWTAPAINGGSAITGYKIEVSEDGGSTWTDLVANTRTTDTSYTHTGLAAGSTRHYRVSAINAGGPSESSDVVSATTAAICTENPGDEWCGVVTVGNRNSELYGFLSAFLTLPTAGDLSDKTFDSYTIDGVWTGTGSNAGKLFFDLTSALTAADKARLVLHVEGRSDGLAFSAATGPSTFNAYNWEGTGLDWSSATNVTLRLRQRTTGICGRTQKVQDEILRQLSGVSDCAAVTAAHLAGLPSEQNMRELDIGSLKSGDFAGLTSVTSLNLSKNKFTTLPAGVFSGLTALRTLSLDSGLLNSLDAGVFSGLTALTTLDLASNALTSLPETVFSGLTALANLNLNDNALRSLRAGVFSGLTGLGFLKLEENKLSELPDGLFAKKVNGAALTFEPVAVVSGLDDVAMVG